MAYVIAEPCIGVKDTACVDACPVDCIHPKKNTTYDDGRPGFDKVSQLYIDPIECIDCGACVPVCPVSAIFALDDLPEKWKHYTEINESYVKAGKFTPEEFAQDQTTKKVRSLVEARFLWQPNFYDLVMLDVRRYSPGETFEFYEQIKDKSPQQRIVLLVGAPTYLSLTWPGEVSVGENSRGQWGETVRRFLTAA